MHPDDPVDEFDAACSWRSARRPVSPWCSRSSTTRWRPPARCGPAHLRRDPVGAARASWSGCPGGSWNARPVAAGCEYYTDGNFPFAEPTWRLCFTDGRLVSKERIAYDHARDAGPGGARRRRGDGPRRGPGDPRRRPRHRGGRRGRRRPRRGGAGARAPAPGGAAGHPDAPLDGLDAAAQIRRLVPDTATVMLTTFGDDDLIARALGHGASGSCSSPATRGN